MSKGHKDLPSGSQDWAGDVAAQLAKIAELEGIVRRLVNDFGLDYSNPQRGLNTGSTPSVANPVQLKLPSLKDLDIRDAQDGDLLTFDGKRGVWTARRHDTVVLPKTFPQGDPASYYVPPTAVGTYAENLFPNPELRTPGAVLPLGFSYYYMTYPESFSIVPDGTGKKMRTTGGGVNGALYFEANDSFGALDKTKGYVFSFDVTFSAGDVYETTRPFAVNHSGGDGLTVPVVALTPGTRRIYKTFPAMAPTDVYHLSSRIYLNNGLVEFSNFQISEIPQHYRRITNNSFPAAETVDVTAAVSPGKRYVVQDLCDGIYTFSFEVTTPAGSTVLFSCDQNSWAQGVVTIPADMLSASFSTTKEATRWHNVTIAETGPDFFEGSMPSDVNYTYSWAGAADDSKSIRTPN